MILYVARRGVILHAPTCRYADTGYKTTWPDTLEETAARASSMGYRECCICRPFTK